MLQTINRWTQDATLPRLLAQYLGPEGRAWLEPRLDRLGAATEQLDHWAALADRHPPRWVPRDRLGCSLDELEFHPAYRDLQRISYGQGIIADYYQPDTRRLLGTAREVAKFAEGYLFSQAEQGLYCPICMTDGSAHLIERFGSVEQQQRYLPHLTATSLDQLWEGAMYLTEKSGGSDVGALETVARQVADQFSLHGEKWFCSNAGAEVALVLARPEGADGGTRGLGLFILPRHRPDGSLNGLKLQRLKDKLGTRSMPTGEYLLEGALAEPLGALDRGFLQMTEMLNLSRLYNSTASVALMRRALSECLRYGKARQSFGRPLLGHVALRQQLIDRLLDLESSLHLVFFLASCRGHVLCDCASSEQQQLLRLLTPLAKLTTGRQAVLAASEAVEFHGGNGYVEDWPLARLLRDAQVLPIWEGTTQILALDTLRSCQKEGCHEALFEFLKRHGQEPSLHWARTELEKELAQLLRDPAAAIPLPWCWKATRAVQASLLLSSANGPRSQRLANRFLVRHFKPGLRGCDTNDFEVLFPEL